MIIDGYIIKYARFIGKDLLGGFDPTGSATIRYGFDDEKSKRNKKSRATAAVVGGAIGGAVVVPSTVGALTYGAKAMKHKGIGMGGAILYGALRPYRSPIHSKRVARAMERVGKTGKVAAPTKDLEGSIRYLSEDKGIMGSGVEHAFGFMSRARGKSVKVSRKQKNKAREIANILHGEASNFQYGIATSSLLGATSAGLQYNKGSELAKK